MLDLFLALTIATAGSAGAAPAGPVPLKTPRPAIWCASVLARQKFANALSEDAAIRIAEHAATSVFRANEAPRPWHERLRAWWTLARGGSRELGVVVPDLDARPATFAARTDVHAVERRLERTLDELAGATSEFKPKFYLVQGRDAIRAYLESVEDEADHLDAQVPPPSAQTKTGIDVTRAKFYAGDVRGLVAAASLGLGSSVLAYGGMKAHHTPSVLAGTVGLAAGYYLVKRALTALRSSGFARRYQRFARPAVATLAHTERVLDLLDEAPDLSRAFAYHSVRIPVPRAGFDGQRMLAHHVTRGLDALSAGEFRGTVHVSLDQILYFDQDRGVPSLLTIIRQ